MPVHDWSRVDAGTFHAFHLAWLGQLQAALNGGLLPSGYYALAEQHAGLVATTSPKGKRRTIAVRHVSGHNIVALIEVVSPANKDRRRSVYALVNKLTAALQLGVHSLLIDLLPPGRHDPDGMHGILWERFDPDHSEHLSPERWLTIAAYAASAPARAYVDRIAVADTLPIVPLLLAPDRFVNVSLEPSYMAAYMSMPKFLRDTLEQSQALLSDQ